MNGPFAGFRFQPAPILISRKDVLLVRYPDQNAAISSLRAAAEALNVRACRLKSSRVDAFHVSEGDRIDRTY